MTQPNSNPAPARRLDLWPMSIIAFFTVAITGCVAFVVFCNLHGTELVAEDYYEQELVYQGRMESAGRALALSAGSGAAITFNSERRVVRVALPATHLDGLRGMVHFYRPSSAGMDVKVALEPDATGGQEFATDRLAPGLWKVRLSWTGAGKDYFLESEIRIPSPDEAAGGLHARAGISGR